MRHKAESNLRLLSAYSFIHYSLLRTISSCRHAEEKESGPVGDDGDVSAIMMGLTEGATSEAAAADKRRSVEIMEEREQFAPKEEMEEEEEEWVQSGAAKGAESACIAKCTSK